MTLSGPDLLFAYGTLRRNGGGPPPLMAALNRHAVWPGPARLGAQLYRVSGYPAAVLCHDGSAQIAGDVWRLSRGPPHGLLARLDAYEGPDYRRRLCAIVPDGGRGPVDAWVYLWRRRVTGLRRIASGDWLAVRRPPPSRRR